MLRAAMFILLLAGPAAATQEYILPTLFDVTGVQTGHRLHIREGPSTSTAIIGRFPHDATNIEVVDERSGWARINRDEGSAWVSMRYLAYRTDVWEAGALLDGHRCFGTEPFWDVRVEGGAAILSGADIPEENHPVQAILDTGVFRDPTRTVLADGLTQVSVPQICSDGMSDRLYGLRAIVVLSGGPARMLNGCCSIQP